IADPVLFSGAGTLVSMLISIPLSAQVGGSENYYFVMSFYLALFAIALFAELFRANAPPCLRLASIAGTVGWASLILATLAVVTGFAGVTSVRAEHEKNMAWKVCLDGLQRPLYVDNQYLSLPWMTPGTLPLVVSYTYPEER